MSKTSSPVFLITRPSEAAERFAAVLKEKFPEALIVISPILEIKYLASKRIPKTDALLFTSVHGVRGFLAAGGVATGAAFCVGTRTAEAASAEGFEIAEIADTAKALEAKIAVFKGSVLYARGVHVATDLSKALLNVSELIVYDQCAKPLSKEAKAVIEGEKLVILPLFSPRSAREAAKEIGKAPGLFVAFLSKAVADAFGEISVLRSETAQRPNAGSMLEICSALYDAACSLEERAEGD